MRDKQLKFAVRKNSQSEINTHTREQQPPIAASAAIFFFLFSLLQMYWNFKFPVIMANGITEKDLARI